MMLRALDRDAVAEMDRQLGLRLDGQPLAATTANRMRIVARACVKAAVYAGAIDGLPLGEAARRLGHRHTLVSNYVGALQDEEEVGSIKIERFLSGGSDR